MRSFIIYSGKNFELTLTRRDTPPGCATRMEETHISVLYNHCLWLTDVPSAETITCIRCKTVLSSDQTSNSTVLFLLCGIDVTQFVGSVCLSVCLSDNREFRGHKPHGNCYINI